MRKLDGLDWRWRRPEDGLDWLDWLVAIVLLMSLLVVVLSVLYVAVSLSGSRAG